MLELPIPSGIRVAEALEVDAARKAPFDSSLDELGGKEGERECHVDLADRAAFALRQLFGVDDRTRGNVLEPGAAARDGFDKANAPLGAIGPDILPNRSVWQKDF